MDAVCHLLSFFKKEGQLGTRFGGGEDAAASRYPFTNLFSWIHDVFRKDDMNLLFYTEDEGKILEPEYFVPIVPMVLINGACGIGTGYSTEIPNFSPEKIIEYLLNKLENNKKNENVELIPYYEGFKGKIEVSPDGKSFSREINSSSNLSNLKSLMPGCERT